MNAPATSVDVLVIGAGFGGIGMALQLQRHGRPDFLVVEQDAGVGGTWWANRYPGAACDIPSVLYSFSFAPNPHWTRRYPGQCEIEAYLNRCVDAHGLRPQLRLGTRVTGMRWDEARARWQVEAERVSDGQRVAFDARVVVAATGGLSRPSQPAIDGLERFGGLACHTARWDDRIGVPGQRVGVIGTGASAIQVVPQLVARGVQLALFQRSAPWVIPRGDAPVSDAERRRRARWPLWLALQRAATYCRYELRAPAFTRWPSLLRRMEPWALRHLQRQVPPGPLRDALTPRYRIGCKRILIADDYYPALQQPNARLVTDPIERIEPRGVRTRDGRLHELDALVLATGFDAAEIAPPFPVTGRGGATLADAWRHGPRAYLGSTVPGFPNLFMLVGPNAGLGHNSIVVVIEAQLRYMLDALGQLDRRRARAADLSPEAMLAFDRELAARMPRTVWATGCRSWYHMRDGRITTLWPGSTIELRLRTRRFDAQRYRFL